MNYNVKQNAIRRAFTLIEMMIVIGIIGILAALTLGISSSVMRNSEIHKTEDVLKLLSMALQEWELERGRAMTFDGYIPVDGGYYDIYADETLGEPVFNPSGVPDGEMLAAMDSRMKNVLIVLMQSEGAKNILSKITPDHFHIDATTMSKVPVDSWGTPIGIVFPGRDFAEAYPNGGSFLVEDESGDLTLRDQAEDGLGSCLNKRPYFVSAGPDRQWGYRLQAMDGPNDNDNDNPIWVASHDNVYSYPPFLVEESH